MPTKARQRGDPRLLDGVSPSWTKLEPLPPPTGKSGLTSSDDQPRYRRGSRRRPKPPKTPPGLVQLEHPSLAVAHFDGKGKGYAAVAPIQASALLLQERPLTVAGAFDSAQDARKALAKIVCDDDRYAHLRGAPEDARGPGRAATKPDGSPPPPSVSGDVWLATLAKLANSPFVRVTRVGNQGAGEPGGGKKDLDTAAEQGDGKDAYAARLLARVSTCNHSCRPNAAVSVSDDLVTLYSLRHIERGEEITVSYGKFIFILVRAISMTSCFLYRNVAPVAAADDATNAAGEGVGVRVQVRSMRAGPVTRDGGAGTGERNDAPRRVQARVPGARILPDATRRLAGVMEWEYGDTGFESQFDEEGRVRGMLGSPGDSPGGKNGGKGGSHGEVRKKKNGGRRASLDPSDTSDSSDTDTSSFDSSDDSSDDDRFGRRGRIRRSGGSKLGRSGRGGVKAIGPARLYNRLVKAGIGPDHWQMHATREVLVSRLLSKEGRKDFDLDLLLEHAHCAARLAPNHPHFIRLAGLVEEVFKTNREVVEAEQYWTWTIDLLREAIHPDVLFWNTEFKGLPPGRVDR